MQNILPDFAIIGAQKSGSTFLQLCLKEHPDIYLPKDEVPFFESPDYEKSSLKDLENYFLNHEEKVKGIKRPNYLGKQEVPSRIQNDLPSAKLLVVLRDPIERAISAYYHNIKYGFIPPRPIEEGMNDILAGNYEKEYPRSSEILEFGKYYQFLKSYDYFLNKGNLLVFKFREMLANKVSTIKRVYSFLEVDNSYSPVNINIRPQKVIYNISRLKFVRLINNNQYQYFDNGKRLRKKEMSILDKIRVYSFKGLDHFVLSKLFSNKKPCISEGLYERMRSIYQKDVKELSNYLGKDFSDWLSYSKYSARYSN